MMVDGTTIILGANSSGTTTTNGMSYTVSISSGTATINLNQAAGVSPATIDTLINGITYQNTSTDNPTAGNRVFTITQIQDNGGTANGGVDTTSLAVSSTVTVVPINDAPGFTVSPGSLSYTENQTATAIAPSVTLTDLDSTTLTSAKVTLTGGYVNGEDVLAFTDQLGITGSFDAANGVLRLTGTTTLANYQTALQSITYQNISDNPNTAARTVIFTVNDGGAVNNLATATRTINVTAMNDAPTGSVTISGTPTQGQTLTASNTLADLDGLGTITYQWQANGTNIAGATGNTLVLGQAQVGQTITVRASYTDGQGTAELVTSAATAAVANINDLPTGSVTITGTATQGQTLTASNTLADVDGLGTISYQWQAGGVDIAGATNSTLVLGQAQVGKTITVKASYADQQGTPESVTSAATGNVANINDAPTGTVSITGTATQGQTLTASNTLADVDGLGTISYQWQADGTDISGATTNTLVLSQAQVGKTITVKASYKDVQGTDESVSSTATSAVLNINDAPTGTVTITGTATQDQTLTASNTLADVDGLGIITYQWQADGADI